jgi:hypothetical protein
LAVKQQSISPSSVEAEEKLSPTTTTTTTTTKTYNLAFAAHQGTSQGLTWRSSNHKHEMYGPSFSSWTKQGGRTPQPQVIDDIAGGGNRILCSWANYVRGW